MGGSVSGRYVYVEKCVWWGQGYDVYVERCVCMYAGGMMCMLRTLCGGTMCMWLGVYVCMWRGVYVCMWGYDVHGDRCVYRGQCEVHVHVQ